MPGFFDIESGPSARFERPGDIVSGVITRPYSRRQATEYLSDKLKFDDQGRAVEMAVIELQTDQRDPSVPNDDGIRILYSEKFGQRKAISDAIKASGASDLEPGGRLTVQYVRDDPSTKGSPLKIWAAQYVAPSAGAGLITGLDKSPSTAPVTQYPTPPIPTQYPQNGPSAGQPALISDARVTQQRAAAQQSAQTVSAPPPGSAPPAINGQGSDIDKVRQLASLGFDKGQIHNAMPQFSMDMIAALLNV